MKTDLLILKRYQILARENYEVSSLNISYLFIINFYSIMSAVRKEISCTSARRDKCLMKLDKIKESGINSSNSRKTTINITSRYATPAKIITDSAKTSSKNSLLTSTVHSSSEAGNRTLEKTDVVKGKVGSLNSSPKWSRIKNKFENDSQRTKLTRSSSLPRDCIDMPVKSLIAKPISKSLSRLNQENNLSHSEKINSSQTTLALNIENEQYAVDSEHLTVISSSEHSAVNVECKKENSSFSTSDSVNVGMSKQCIPIESSTSSKLKVPFNKSFVNSQSTPNSLQGCPISKGVSSVPCSARLVAKSLLPSNNSFIAANRKKCFTNYSSASTSVHKSSVEKKLNDIYKKNSNSSKYLGCKPCDMSQSNSFAKKSAKPHFATKSSHLSATDNENSCQKQIPYSHKTNLETSESILPSDNISRYDVIAVSVSKDNTSDSTKQIANFQKHFSPATKKKLFIMNTVNKAMHPSNRISCKMQNQCEIPAPLWTQTQTGSWSKILSEKAKADESAENKESKVALLTSKFNALTLQDSSEPVSQNVNDLKIPSKSPFVSSISSTALNKSDWNHKNSSIPSCKTLTKSSTVASLHDQSISHKMPSNLVSGKSVDFIAVANNENKKNDPDIFSSKLFSLKNGNASHTNKILKEKCAEICSLEDSASSKTVKKLSIVQKAVLSYEESLALLSPESQRKYIKINGNSKSEIENERLFSDIKESYSAPLLSHATKRDKQDSLNSSDDSNKFLTSHNILTKMDEHDTASLNFKVTSLWDSISRNIKNEQFQCGKFIPEVMGSSCDLDVKEGKSDLLNLITSGDNLEEPTCCSLYCNILSKQAKEPEKCPLQTVPNIVCKTPVPLPRKQMPSREQPLYVNGCDKSTSSYSFKGCNTNIEVLQKDKHISLQPNASFLWRHSNEQDKSDSFINECDDLYCDFENYYSSVLFQNAPDFQKSSVDSDESEFLKSDTKVMSSAVNLSSIKGHDRVLKDGHNESENEDWMDISDAETSSCKIGNKIYSPTGTLKARNKLKRISYHKELRRSWSQSLRDLAKASANVKSESEPKDGWYSDEYNDVCVWEMFDGTDNSSGSTETDHYYEPVYESLSKYLVDKEDSDDSCSISYSPEEAVVDLGRSSNTSLEFIGNDKPELPPSNKPLITSSNNFSTGLGKKAGEKIRQLKRNWSLTKSDIRLELSSKLNKIKIKKHVSSSAEIDVRVQESKSSAPKKKTLIKCILKQKSPVDAPSRSLPSPKKDNAMFYVQLSVANEKQRPFSDSYTKGIPSNERQNCLDLRSKVRKTSEPSFLFVKSYDDAKLPNGRGKRGSLKNNIQRPKTPPPLPPVSSSKSNITEMKPLEKQENFAHYQIPTSKGLSLDSSYHSSYPGVIYSALNKSDASEMKKSFSASDARPSSTQSVAKATSTQGIPGLFSLFAGFKGESNSLLYNTEFCISSRIRNSIASSGSSVESYLPADEGEILNMSSSTPSSISLTPPIPDGDILVKIERTKDGSTNETSLHFGDTTVETLKSPFEEEPLYQFYQRDVLQRATLWYADSSESELEDDDFYKTSKDEDNAHIENKQPSKSQMSAMELVHGEVGGQRTLWCEVPEVLKSGILGTITVQDRKLQEAMFEVITSEASYLKSLNILVGHFLHCPEFADDYSPKCVLNKREKHILFSDVLPVREVCIRLLADLEKRWLQNILISNVCDIIYEHAWKNFNVYVKYCSNQVYKDRMLKELKETKPDFIEVLRRLECSPVCQGLDMHSFLMLPMQRITRLPLLIDAIFHRLSLDSPIYENCKMALAVLNKIVAECNEGARKMERMEEMLRISHQLVFKECKNVGLISSSRWLVKKGELIRLRLDTGYKRTFGRSTRWSKATVYFFLFTDLLVITKKKSEDNYYVLDYCPRNMMQVLPIDSDESSDFQLPIRPPPQYKNLFQLIMLNNHEGKTVEIILSCSLESDRTRWMEAVTPPTSENPDERIYEEWDCPQVQCIHAYIAQQPDELSLEQTDVVNVFRKIADGWYEGERIRDGVRGWFPASHTMEIISSHVRARNLRQRYRLLMLSQTWLEEQHKAQIINQGKGK